jgi:hypothetical protein
MAKRIIAGILGTLAVFASLLPSGYAFEIFKDFKNPDVSFWSNVLGVLFMCSIALVGLWVGIRFLRFASSGRSQQSNSWMEPVLLGIGFFFPGFVLSLPLTVLWARLTWPGNDGKIDLALQVSVFVGAAAATICTILLIRKRILRHTS